MKIRKGTLVLVEKSSMPYLRLVKEINEDNNGPYFLLNDKSNKRKFSADDVIPLVQTNPKRVHTVNQAMKIHHRLIIKRLLEEV